MKISDVYDGDSLLLTNTELGKDTYLYLNRMEQAELCVFLAETRDHR